jgi:uncharacterized protein
LHRRSSRLLLSASDLVAFHDCGHLTQLDRRALDDPDLRAQRCADDEHAQLIQRKGHEFEACYLARLEATHPDLIKIDHTDRDPDRLAAATLATMRSGAPLIYQATLLHEDLVGHADFLRRVELRSHRHQARPQREAEVRAAAVLLQRAARPRAGRRAAGDARRARHG